MNLQPTSSESSKQGLITILYQNNDSKIWKFHVFLTNSFLISMQRWWLKRIFTSKVAVVWSELSLGNRYTRHNANNIRYFNCLQFWKQILAFEKQNYRKIIAYPSKEFCIPNKLNKTAKFNEKRCEAKHWNRRYSLHRLKPTFRRTASECQM